METKMETKMEITTKANQLKGKIKESDLKDLELFFANTNLSEEQREKLVKIIENIITIPASTI